MTNIYLLLVRAYKAFSMPIYSIMPGYMGCRYWPSCSNYSYKAVERFGLGKGLILTVKRLVRCNPLSKGGVDEIN